MSTRKDTKLTKCEPKKVKKSFPITKSESQKSKIFLPKHHPVVQENSKLILPNNGLNIAIGCRYQTKLSGKLYCTKIYTSHDTPALISIFFIQA